MGERIGHWTLDPKFGNSVPAFLEKDTVLHYYSSLQLWTDCSKTHNRHPWFFSSVFLLITV